MRLVLPEELARRGCKHVEEQLQETLEAGRANPLHLELFGPPQQLVRVADHTGPAKIANRIDDLCGPGSAEDQIACMNRDVRGRLPQIVDDGLQRCEVGVNVGNYRDSDHGVCNADER